MPNGGISLARGAFAVLCFSLAALYPGAVTAEARLEVKGDTLRGRVVDLTSAGVEFESIYGAGSILVPWSDVEDLVTEDQVVLMFGDQDEATGRVLGVRDGEVLIGESLETALRVKTKKLFHAYPDDFGDSVMDRLRSRLRYWTAAFDLGAAYTDATTDKATGFAALRIDRVQGPTRLLLEGAGRYANEKEKGEERSVTENQIYGFTRGEYDVTERFYDYVSMRATHDTVQDLSLRLEPRGGFGVHVIKRPDLKFSTDVGITWIFEDYFGDEFIDGAFPLQRDRGRENHWAIAFGAQASAKLPYGALWRARAEYLPAVDDWANDYLARLETAIDFPLLDWLAFTISLRDEYDNTPAEGSQRNSLTTTAALSFRFP